MTYFDEDEIEEIAEGEVKVRHDGITATVQIGDSALEAVAAGISARLENAVSRKVEKEISAKINELVDNAVTKIIGSRADDLVREALEKPRQKTNEWGTPTGPSVSFAELIPGIVERYLNATVDEQGRPSTYSGDNKRTRASWIIATHVRAHIDPVTTNAVATVTKQARDVVAQKIAAFVSEQMVPAIEVSKPR